MFADASHGRDTPLPSYSTLANSGSAHAKLFRSCSSVTPCFVDFVNLNLGTNQTVCLWVKNRCNTGIAINKIPARLIGHSVLAPADDHIDDLVALARAISTQIVVEISLGCIAHRCEKSMGASCGGAGVVRAKCVCDSVCVDDCGWTRFHGFLPSSARTFRHGIGQTDSGAFAG
jgi:hypothetical protein